MPDVPAAPPVPPTAVTGPVANDDAIVPAFTQPTKPPTYPMPPAPP
jgi:hypothetical protein